MRLFVAIDLPPHIRAALASIQSGVPGSRWTSAENMHLSLRFFGETDGGQAEDLAYELQRIDQSSFDIELDGAGQFSRGAEIKMLWMGLKPLEPLITLNTNIERAARRSGFPMERRAFKPHITLARFSYPPEINQAREYLERHGQFQQPPFRISGFSLYSSQLRPEGPIYRAEADFPFADANIGDTSYFDEWADAK